MGIGAHLVVAWHAHQIHGKLQHLLKFLLDVDVGVGGGGGFATHKGDKQANAPEMKAISPALACVRTLEAIATCLPSMLR